MKVLFTDRVTSDFVDVDYVCDLKLSPTQSFFNYDPDRRNVWFEFLCDYRGKPCLIKLDVDTRELEVLGRLEPYGTIMWNCPLHSWDARFVLQARKVLNSDGSAFKSLADTFFIPPDSQLPEISFRTETSDLIVKKVYFKRESRYLVLPNSLTGPRNFEFCMTEIQDLWLQSHISSEEVFKASATDRLSMIGDERLYYTFTLVPTKFEEIFQTQTVLEIGEIPQWTAASILGPIGEGVIEAMTGIISAVIERIDDVGFNNRGSWVDNP